MKPQHTRWHPLNETPEGVEGGWKRGLKVEEKELQGKYKIRTMKKKLLFYKYMVVVKTNVMNMWHKNEHKSKNEHKKTTSTHPLNETPEGVEGGRRRITKKKKKKKEI